VRSIIVMIVCCSFCSLSAPAADHTGPFRCGTRAGSVSVQRTAETGGIYLPSSGVLRVLIVFASFADDETPHPYWHAHQPPDSMARFIDPDTTTGSTDAFNLTHYFRQMSLGKLQVIGDAVWVESSHSQEEYRNSGSYGAANMAVLPEKVDPIIDFSRYDNWTKLGDYSHVNVPDSIVDMVIMVWRTTMWGYLGEASLGYKPAIPVDGKRIEMGYPAYYPQPIGSGVTCEYPYGDDPSRVMRTMVHEMSHWLLGIFHPYNGLKPDGKFQYWGMLCNGERISACANTYDREQLGWIVPTVLDPGTTVRLADFVTTGAAGKFHPPSGEPQEFLYLENHQGLSVFDDVTLNSADRGVWVLHQQGPYVEMDNLRILPSDGDWQWSGGTVPSACFGSAVPVFSRGEPDVGAGLSHRDQIPTSTSLLNWMIAYRNDVGEVDCAAHYGGAGFRGAFDPSSSVFSTASNPAALTWTRTPAAFSFEVTGDTNGTVSCVIPHDALTLSPARRYLGASPSSSATGTHSVAWGSQWKAGPPLESDVVWSELQRAVGSGGGWATVYAGTAFSWTDSSMWYDSSGTTLVRFRARVRDSQGKYSGWSMEHRARATRSTGVPGQQSAPLPAGPVLHRNYPNPFNPSTSISCSLPGPAWVTLEIMDVLGRRVKLLYAGRLGTGTHTMIWNGSDDRNSAVSAGVYLCRLICGESILTDRMLLVK
jgi:hypothetical protein